MISTFYIYVDGSDLAEIASGLRTRIEDFVSFYGGRVRVVEQRRRSGWDLGVNFEFDSLADAEKKDLLLFFQNLSAEFDRDFIIGGELPHGLTEDLVTLAPTESLEPAIVLLTSHAPKG